MTTAMKDNNNYELSIAEKKELDKQKKLHTEGKTKSYTVSEVRNLVSSKR